MITQIQLGNIFTQNDKTVISGGSTGLDIEALINGLADAKRQPAVILEANIETNNSVSTAIGELRTILDRFRDASNFLRNPPGVQNDADNIFQFRSTSVASNTTVTGDNYLSVTAEPGASATDYDIEITQLATRNVYTTNTITVADADTAIVGPGPGDPLLADTLTLGASATPIDIEVGDSLNQVAAKINAASDLSGVEATVIKVADGEFRLSLKTVETGTAQNYVPGGTVFDNIGFAITENAQDAIVEFDGTTITRSANNIDDIVEGVTFNLLQETPPGTELDVEVQADLDLAKQGILNLVDAYNEFRLFSSSQTETGSDGQPLDGSILSSNSVLTLTSTRINSEVASIVDGIVAGDPSRLADIGITFSDFPGDAETPFTRNILVVDEDTLDNALSADFDAVRKVFEFDFIADDPDLQIFQRTNALGVSEFDLNIDQTNGIYQATYDNGGTPVTIDLDGETLTGSDGVILTGQEGTVLEGLTLIYGSNDDATVDVTVTQGIADRLYNTLDNLLDEDTGAIEVELRSLSDENERIQEDINRIDEQLESFREQLLRQFSALEAAISSANTLLQTLDAQAQARQSA